MCEKKTKFKNIVTKQEQNVRKNISPKKQGENRRKLRKKKHREKIAPKLL